jgi:putative transposase
VIALPRTSFYYRPTASAAQLSDDRLIELIGEIQDDFPGYGYRRVTHELRRRGLIINTNAFPE